MIPETDIRVLMSQSHRTACDKGWWDGDERSLGNQFANFHSELSEAWEEIRNGNNLRLIYSSESSCGPKPEGVAVELADLLIRVFDTCEKYDIPLVEALSQKMAYNNHRPYRHGGKTA
ncbi:MAG: hypothetical protein ACLQLG_08865 [Thermoguttaceae bacterium]